MGAASGGIAASCLGILGSMYEGQARSQALGYATGTLTLAGIVFPILGGLIGKIHWQYTFYLYAVALPLAVLVALTLRQQPSSKTPAKTEEPNYKLRHVLGRYQTLLLLLTLSLTSVIMYSVAIYGPLYFKATLNANTLLNGIILASRALGAAIVSAFGARRLSQALGLPKAIAIGFGLMAVTLAIIPLIREISWILFTAVLFGAGFGIVLPSLYDALAGLAPAKLRASILSAGTGAGFLGQSLCPILLGFVLYNSRLEVVFYTAASLSAIAATVLLLFGNKLAMDIERSSQG